MVQTLEVGIYRGGLARTLDLDPERQNSIRNGGRPKRNVIAYRFYNPGQPRISRDERWLLVRL